MPALTDLSDDDLLRLLAAGDEEAFVTLYRRRSGSIYRYALQMSGSAGTAEDVTQEAFLTVMRDASRYDPARGPVAAWLFGIARNHVLRCLERERRYVPVEDDAADEPSAAEGALEDLTRAETLESVRQAVLALPAPYRETVVICDLQEMSYEEASKILGCSVGTVRSRLHRGRALLARKLRQQVRCSI